MNLRLFRGMNSGNTDQIDPDSFRFHGPMKAMFYRLLNLINPPPREWLDRVTGNNAVLKEIYDDYLKHEKQAWRREVLERVIPFSILLTADGSDENYGEVMEWFLWRICQAHEEGRFTFDPLRITPECWFQDGRGRLNFHETIRTAMRQQQQQRKKESD